MSKRRRALTVVQDPLLPNAKPSEITSYHTEECRGYGMDEHTEPVFYIEVKINNKGE